MKTANVNALKQIVEAFNSSNGAIDMNLGDDKWTKATGIQSCGIRVFDHHFVSNRVVSKVVSSILT
jgi:hypothetical protein